MIIDKLIGAGYPNQYAVACHSNDTGETTIVSVHEKISDAVVAAVKVYGVVLTITNAINLQQEGDSE